MTDTSRSETSAAADSPSWKAVEHLVMHTVGDRIRIMAPGASTRLLVPREVARLLLVAGGEVVSIDHARGVFGWDEPRAKATFDLLVQHRFLVAADEQQPGLTTPWSEWGLLAWAYHQSVSRPGAADVADVPGPAESTAALADLDAPPSSFPAVTSEPALLLPRRSSRIRRSFVEIIEERRTHRSFEPLPVTADDLSEILRTTFGPVGFVDAGPLGILQLRAAASGGARHETDAYVCVLDVEGIEPGLYAYDSLRHGLVARGEGPWRETLEALTLEQGFFLESAFGVLTVARTERMSWKYHTPGAYKVLWQNVGHLAQVLSMTCAGLDLGASITGGLRQADARALLGLQDGEDIVTLAMAVGHPRRGPAGRPVGVDAPRKPFSP